MKKFSLLGFLLVFFIFQSSFVSAQTNKNAEIKRIDAYSKRLDALSEKAVEPDVVFADASDYNEKKPKWRRYSSRKEFEKARETSEFHNIAFVWRKNGRIVLANFTFDSPSGDWAHFVYHYFREDGTLAKVEAQLNTFNGNMTVLRNFYFDRNGKLLRKTTKYLDLETKKPKNLKEVGDFYDNEVKIFKKTVNLPFASRLRKKRN